MPPDISRIRPVLLCGGMGRRLYPLSTPQRPKPFLKLYSDFTMFQETLLRVKTAKSPAIICNRAHSDLVSRDMDSAGISADIILKEPVSRNTAPAVALACRYYADKNPEEVLLFLPCDHIIEYEERFLQGVSESFDGVRNGDIILFGEKPQQADTGYGYIKAEGETREGPFKVDRFHEKPDMATAMKYVSAGYYWNTGIIMAKAGVFLNKIKEYAPSVFCAGQSISPLNVSTSEYNKSEDISIDYAVLEKLSDLKMKQVTMGWADIGTIDRLSAFA